MASTVNVEELDKFNDMVDQLIDDIEKGKVTANPLKPDSKSVAEIGDVNVTVAETATELGEEAAMETPAATMPEPVEVEQEETVETPAAIEVTTPEVAVANPDSLIILPGKGEDGAYKAVAFAPNSKEAPYTIDGGRVGKNLVKVTNQANYSAYFASPAAVAALMGINPTTTRTWADNERIDTNGNIWQYE